MAENEKYMKRALELARQASEQDEVPIGAVVVDSLTGEIVAEAHNESEHGSEATAHAELLAMQKACQKLKSKRLWNMDLYVTLEPCTMCAAAISFMRIKTLYFGAVDVKGGAVVSGVRFYEQSTCHHKPEVFQGLYAEECGEMLKKFFRIKRDKKS
ncbi:MAG: nucleoside deaminase [Alphaproteobacteria bacterium]|nr:nucleoside deaminase [Alphaproteobacteria bacterium]